LIARQFPIKDRFKIPREPRVLFCFIENHIE